MRTVDTWAAADDGVLAGGHHEHRDRHKNACPYEEDRQVEALATVADGMDKGPGAYRDAVGLLLFTFAAGSPWGPARRWLLRIPCTENARGLDSSCPDH